ncbi:MAG: SHOCT domain-containing protein [Lachnospiraceae bacterium]|nr:SHOCT domain-containing protein [Lachnospiraceae bacterium]
MARNMVIEGDYKGKNLKVGMIGKGKEKTYCASIVLGGFKKDIFLTPDTVSMYEVVTEAHQKSAKSGVTKGLIGGALLGPVGLLAGGVSGKTKGTYNIVVSFKDGKRSLLEIDDNYYNMIVEKLALLRYCEPEAPAEQSAQPGTSFIEEEPVNNAPKQSSSYSAADEIMKYKNLLDSGVITKKEFEKKKKQLLK